MTYNALERGRAVQSVPSDFLSAHDNRAKAKLLMARQVAMGAGQIFDKLPLSMQRNFMTLSGNMLATIERLARVTW